MLPLFHQDLPSVALTVTPTGFAKSISVLVRGSTDYGESTSILVPWVY